MKTWLIFSVASVGLLGCDPGTQFQAASASCYESPAALEVLMDLRAQSKQIEQIAEHQQAILSALTSQPL
jgi:hypothetical protein